MIDWRMAKRDGVLEIFQADIQENLCLLLGNRRDSEMQLNTEIRHVAQLSVDTATRTFPQPQSQKKTRISDDTLSQLCALSMATWKGLERSRQKGLYMRRSVI